MSKSSKSRPKRTQMQPKRTPESFQDQRCDQRNPEKVSRGGPKAPEAPQRPTKAEKYEKPWVKLMFVKKTSNSLSKTKVLLIKPPSGHPPQRGPKIGIRLLKVAPRTSDSLIFDKWTALKSGCLKR